MSLIAAGACDIGRVRRTNQDAIYLNVDKRLFIVADGMGGHNGGDIASAMAVKYIPEYFLENKNLEPLAVCKKSVLFANKKIKLMGEDNPLLKGMGTTVSSCFFFDKYAYITNVGDSRTYLVNNNRLYQMTRDHSLVQEKLNMGIYTREQAKEDPQKNILIRTVGFEDPVDVDVYTYNVSKNDIFLSCSDGLYGKVSDQDIIYLINKYIPDPSKATFESLNKTVQTLVELANANGGNDNISVILVAAL